MTTWHADEMLLADYVRGDADPLLGASLEQHLTHCADCRARIGAYVDTPVLEAVWTRIRDRAETGRPPAVERLLVRLGVSEPDALLVARAPSLGASWLFGLAATVAFAGVGAAWGGTAGLAFFLLLAPLVPVAGVAFAYGPDVDPAYELGLAAPYPAARLLLLRTAAVLVSSLPLSLLTGLLIPAMSWTAVSWLLPALAFTATVLAASTWARPSVVAVLLGVGWVLTVGAASRASNPAAVLAPALLLTYAVLGVAAVLVLCLRIRHFARLGSSS
ncbi:MAG: integral rane protein [Blastococcus sp.]|jgi:hypothetical protein|nr:integral rane protein [Blastococcus sp.]